MQVLTAETGHGLGHGGFQRTGVPNPLGTALPLDLLAVNFENLFESEEKKIHPAVRSVSELLEGAAVTLVR